MKCYPKATLPLKVEIRPQKYYNYTNIDKEKATHTKTKTDCTIASLEEHSAEFGQHRMSAFPGNSYNSLTVPARREQNSCCMAPLGLNPDWKTPQHPCTLRRSAARGEAYGDGGAIGALSASI
ncbi:unnamed protein product [Acanthoscelides obtectus]|uniref:Uncharacterized protein n=1 Tax=Acanthoscelides obtectus TaxID=200917 RepID=A0A9P0LIS5_ACAOB|nr:unnamed protein product [Acanthoscelides obtectus]CAK1652412.1 hypothetical protein AOBTE_LOCUS17825 [Acanthoscelides obtectus]